MTQKRFSPSGAGGEEDDSGLSMLDVLTLPDDQQQVINWITRQGNVSFAELVARVGQDEKVAQTMLDILIEKGFVIEIPGEEKSHYRTKMATKRRRELPNKIWQALE